LKNKYVFRVLGWEISIQNIKAYERFAKEYDEAVDEYCKEQAELEQAELAGEKVG
jgi:hypothetical protein